MNTKEIGLAVGFSIIFLMVSGLAIGIIYEIANSTCEESEMKPVRYEMSGIAGNKKTAITTTEGNHDAYEKVCVRRGNTNLRYWSVTSNLEHIIKRSMEGEQ